MCLSCGCDLPDDDHGNPQHITWATLDRAAAAAGISPDEAAANIVATLRTSKDAVKVARRRLKDGPGRGPDGRKR